MKGLVKELNILRRLCVKKGYQFNYLRFNDLSGWVIDIDVFCRINSLKSVYITGIGIRTVVQRTIKQVREIK